MKEDERTIKKIQICEVKTKNGYVIKCDIGKDLTNKQVACMCAYIMNMITKGISQEETVEILGNMTMLMLERNSYLIVKNYFDEDDGFDLDFGSVHNVN